MISSACSFINRNQKTDIIDKILIKNGYNTKNEPHIKEYLCLMLIKNLCVAKNPNLKNN